MDMFKKPEKIIITMNPDELRGLADRMEEAYLTRTVGQTTFVDFLGNSRDLHVCLHFDQAWFEERR